METIGTAVVGFGLAGRVFHAPFVHAVAGLTLRTIVQRHGDAAALAYPASSTGVQVVRSFSEALDDRSIELVVIATPNDTHFSLAEQALRAGKHVVVDKPLTSTSAEAAELIQVAIAHKRYLIPFHNRRWDGDFLTVKRLLSHSALGRLVTFQSRFDRFRPGKKAGSWKEREGHAHGILYDLGPHLLDQALVLFGVPESLYASVRRDRSETDIDDAFDLQLSYPGLQVGLGATMLAAEPSPRYLLHGTSGSYRKYGVDPQEPTLVAGGRVPEDGSTQDWLTEPEESWGQLRTPSPDGGALGNEAVPAEPGDYRRFYAGVRDAIRLGAAPPVTTVEAWRVLRLLELARESSARGVRLHVDLSDSPETAS